MKAADLVLLPGLDGTGSLFRRLLVANPKRTLDVLFAPEDE